MASSKSSFLILLYYIGSLPPIIRADIHQYHLLARLKNGQWQLSRLFDFDDALLGLSEYDLAAAGLFLMAGRPLLLGAFLLTYGYAQADLNEHLSHRLLAYTLLHRYRPFTGCTRLLRNNPVPHWKS